MPRLWSETIEAHRREVRDAILDAAAGMALERGPFAITMSEIAEGAGIGRATLYKYFRDVPSILSAWHEREIGRHLSHLRQIAASAQPAERLTAVLEGWAHIVRRIQGHAGTDLALLLHRKEQVATAENELQDLVEGLLREAVEEGLVRDDVPVAELAAYCLHAVTAAGASSSNVSIRRLLEVTVAGLRPAQ